VLTENGELWCFGNDDTNQLGQGGEGYEHGRRMLRPVRVCLGGVEEERCLLVACGWKHTLCYTASGKLFSWGGNWHGKLGRCALLPPTGAVRS
jgi:alpha-tubulin suppressor-like RCC1 family protein